MTGPPKRLGQEDRARLLNLIEKHARIEVGLRTGCLTEVIGKLSLANDMVNTLDEIREIVLGTSDLGELADKFGYKWGGRKCRDSQK